jgi:hypothetical protein
LGAPTCEAAPELARAYVLDIPDLNSSRWFSGSPARSELAALYLRAADTLDRSAELAEDHARRERDDRRPHSADLELECAARARAAAQRGRAPLKCVSDRASHSVATRTAFLGRWTGYREVGVRSLEVS